MKIRTINLDEEGNPSSLSVDMTAREAAFLVRMIGSTTHTDRKNIQVNGGNIGSDIHDVLSNEIFNRFYENGMNDVPR